MSAVSGIRPPSALPLRRRLRVGPATLAVLAVALVLRLVVVFADPGFLALTDAGDYDHTAVTLAVQGSFPSSFLTPQANPSAFRPPLFPVLLAGVYELSGTGDVKARWRAGRILEALLGTIAVALIGLIARGLWDRRVAITASAIAAIYPPLILAGSSLMSESLFIPLMLGAVLAALRYRRHRRAGYPRHRLAGWLIGTGVLIGLGALTRSNGIALVIPLGLLVWAKSANADSARSAGGRFPRARWLRQARPVLVLVAAVAVTLVPWTVRNEYALHAFVPTSTESGDALAGTYEAAAQHDALRPALWLPPTQQLHRIWVQHPHAGEAEVNTALEHDGFDYIKAHPGSVLRTAYWDTIRLLNLSGTGFERWIGRLDGYPDWLSVLSVYSFWALGLLAVAGAFTRRARAVPKALWWCPAVLLLSTVLLIGASRYRIPADPFFVLLAALAVLAPGRRRQGEPVPSPAE